MEIFEFLLKDVWIKGKGWKYGNTIKIKSDNPRNALTKLRIKFGEDAYRRCCLVFSNNEVVKELSSYGMYVEQRIRDNGRMGVRKWERQKR